MKKFFIIFVLPLLFIGCEEQASDAIVNGGVNEGEQSVSFVQDLEDVVTSESFEESTSEDDLEEVIKKERVEELEFSYDSKSGECLDVNQEFAGLNIGDDLECGDLINQEVSNIDFDREKPYGLDLSGSIIPRSQKLKISYLYKYEVLFDNQTVFEDRKNFLKKVLKNFKKREGKLNKRILNLEKRIILNQERVASLEKRIDQGVSEKREVKFLKRIDVKEKNIEKLKLKAQRASVKLKYINLIQERFN